MESHITGTSTNYCYCLRFCLINCSRVSIALCRIWQKWRFGNCWSRTCYRPDALLELTAIWTY